MSSFPNAVSPAIVGARRDGDSIVLIALVEGKGPGITPKARYEFRMSEDLAKELHDELEWVIWRDEGVDAEP